MHQKTKAPRQKRPAQKRPPKAPPAPRPERPDAAPLADPNTQRRILSLSLPRFAIEQHLRAATWRGDTVSEEQPLALAVEGRHGPVIQATTRAAEAGGAVIGARVVDTRALMPEIRIEYADTGAQQVALKQLMFWARRWCPWTALDGADALIMDVSGAAHLWGQEPEMLARMEEELSHLGLSAMLAIAPTHSAAWALARFAGPRAICAPPSTGTARAPSDDMTSTGPADTPQHDRAPSSIAQPSSSPPSAPLTAQMHPLPVEALRLDPQTILLLQRLGLKTIGALAAVPRLSLARRFSRAALPANPL
ncbi:MAG: DNA polymerase Y family protein, partial [Rhodobacteraceae bacterium]|nr:DNA polymerase Y family protein [Paracoccaceae bacterium]